MLSRDAEHLSWLARYIERAENTGRLINVNVEMMLDYPIDDSLGWEPILEAMDSKKDYLNDHKYYEESNVIHYLSRERNNPNSIASCLHNASYNSEFIKDDLPRSAVEELNNIEMNFLKEMTASVSKRKRAKNIYEVISSSQRFFGIISDRHYCKPYDLNGLLESEYNSFEEVVLKNYPELIQTKYWLSSFGKVRMSGTGSTRYIEFDSYESAIEANKEIGNRYRSKMVSSLESYDIFS